MWAKAYNLCVHLYAGMRVRMCVCVHVCVFVHMHVQDRTRVYPLPNLIHMPSLPLPTPDILEGVTPLNQHSVSLKQSSQPQPCIHSVGADDKTQESDQFDKTPVAWHRHEKLVAAK